MEKSEFVMGTIQIWLAFFVVLAGMGFIIRGISRNRKELVILGVLIKLSILTWF